MQIVSTPIRIYYMRLTAFVSNIFIFVYLRSLDVLWFLCVYFLSLLLNSQIASHPCRLPLCLLPQPRYQVEIVKWKELLWIMLNNSVLEFYCHRTEVNQRLNDESTHKTHFRSFFCSTFVLVITGNRMCVTSFVLGIKLRNARPKIHLYFITVGLLAEWCGNMEKWLVLAFENDEKQAAAINKGIITARRDCVIQRRACRRFIYVVIHNRLVADTNTNLEITIQSINIYVYCDRHMVPILQRRKPWNSWLTRRRGGANFKLFDLHLHELSIFHQFETISDRRRIFTSDLTGVITTPLRLNGLEWWESKVSTK